jgi:anti-sigma28 factor (negative regulator of flagellin synthesis)
LLILDPTSFPQTKGAANRMSPKIDSERLKMLKRDVMMLPDVRKEKVEALRRLVENGKYEVTDAEIADALLNDRHGPGPK